MLTYIGVAGLQSRARVLLNLNDILDALLAVDSILLVVNHDIYGDE